MLSLIKTGPLKTGTLVLRIYSLSLQRHFHRVSTPTLEPPVRQTVNFDSVYNDLARTIQILESNLTKRPEPLNNGSTGIQMRRLAYLLESNAVKLRDMQQRADLAVGSSTSSHSIS